jgi:hypothetical protein
MANHQIIAGFWVAEEFESMERVGSGGSGGIWVVVFGRW